MATKKKVANVEESMVIMGKTYTAEDVRDLDSGAFAWLVSRAKMTDDDTVREWVQAARGDVDENEVLSETDSISE